MSIFHLPQDILVSRKKSEKIVFHNYAAEAGAYKTKSILHKNAISLVISGEKTMRFGEKTVYIKEDEFHFLSAGNCIVSMNSSGKKLLRSILIFFDDKTLNDFYLKYNTKISEYKREHNVGKEHYIAFKKDEVVLNFIYSLKLLIQSETEISTEMKMLKFEELMLYLLERYPTKLLSFHPAKAKHADDLRSGRLWKRISSVTLVWKNWRSSAISVYLASKGIFCESTAHRQANGYCKGEWK